ncbi:MAG TPA: hypothetical protein VGK22_02630 [Candidatus Angelobacter sp.]|jgi:hypothetical protein
MTEFFRDIGKIGFTAALAFYFLLIFLRQASRITGLLANPAQSKGRLVRAICGKRIWNDWPLPVFTYFSHLPDVDLRVFSRQISALGNYSLWQSAGYRNPGVMRWLFNPDRRRAKIIKDTAAMLVYKISLDIAAGEEHFLVSPEYKLLVNSAARWDLDPSSLCQFLICHESVSDLDREPEILFVSRVESREMWYK